VLYAAEVFGVVVGFEQGLRLVGVLGGVEHAGAAVAVQLRGHFGLEREVYARHAPGFDVADLVGEGAWGFLAGAERGSL
jgi:hypothetical protein